MNSPIRTTVAAAALALLAPTAAIVTVLTPSIAAAQRGPVTPEIDRLEVNTDGGLAPGAQLTFRLEGTPKARASLALSSQPAINIALRETSAGIYEGNYVIRRNDRIRDGDRLRATLRHGNRIANANYQIPEGAARRGFADRDGREQRADRTFMIERFRTEPVARFDPGTELIFTLEGPRGAQASLDIGGVDSNVPMREVRPGVYEGRYTLRRQDRLSTSTPVIATLRSGQRTVTSNLVWPGGSPAADNRAPQITRISPAEGARVAAGNVTISGALNDPGVSSGVDPRSVRVVVNGRDMTANSRIDDSGFTTPSVLTPGRYDVQVTARDRAGNEVRRAWSFDVGAGGVPPVGSPPLAIQLNTPAGMVVDGRGPIQMSGRTASGAMVHATVTALARGSGPIGSAQQVYNQTIQADQYGQFAFTFQPVMAPDVNYDVTLVATQAGRREETRVRLDQR